jgi:hypothetical protein
VKEARCLSRWITLLRARRDRLRVHWLERRARSLVRRSPGLLESVSPESVALQQRFSGLSINRSNLLRLQHDRVMRPQELQGLLLAWLACGEPSPALAGLLAETCTDAPTLLAAPAHYAEPVVRDLGEAQLRWYRREPSGPSSGSESERRLVVAFASNANAVSMIAPCFLQLLGPLRTDVVLVLRDRPQQRSFYGPDGGTSLLARLLLALPSLVPLAEYREVVTIGYSGGGFAAAVAAVALGADRGVSLGGWPPQGAVAVDRSWMEALRSAVPAARPVAPRLLLCCSGGSGSDREGTARAAALAAGWDLPLAGLETRVYGGCRDHNLLVELQRRRYALAPVMADLLFPGDGRLTPKPLLARRARWRPLPTPWAASF